MDDVDPKSRRGTEQKWPFAVWFPVLILVLAMGINDCVWSLFESEWGAVWLTVLIANFQAMAGWLAVGRRNLGRTVLDGLVLVPLGAAHFPMVEGAFVPGGPSQPGILEMIFVLFLTAFWMVVLGAILVRSRSAFQAGFREFACDDRIQIIDLLVVTGAIAVSLSLFSGCGWLQWRSLRITGMEPVAEIAFSLVVFLIAGLVLSVVTGWPTLQLSIRVFANSVKRPLWKVSLSVLVITGIGAFLLNASNHNPAFSRFQLLGVVSCAVLYIGTLFLIFQGLQVVCSKLERVSEVT